MAAVHPGGAGAPGPAGELRKDPLEGHEVPAGGERRELRLQTRPVPERTAVMDPEQSWSSPGGVPEQSWSSPGAVLEETSPPLLRVVTAPSHLKVVQAEDPRLRPEGLKSLGTSR